MSQARSEPVEIGVDIGGTFTDVVCRFADGTIRVFKTPTTPADPSAAVLQSIAFMADAWGVTPDRISRFVHGTTVATNAVLERKGAVTGLLTTAGFRDVLEIGRQMRQAMYSVILAPETPVFLAPGARRQEVRERITAAGEVLLPLDEADVHTAVAKLVEAGVEAIAVSFLFSFLDPSHEQRARELIQQSHPDLAVSISSEVDPTFREYERTVVTAFDAYIKPVIERYLQQLEASLSAAGATPPLQIMQSRGGIAASVVVRERPVRLFLSGPAAGVIGAQTIGRSAGQNELITLDIGGTSCDIALVSDGKPLVRTEGRIDGFPVRVPMVDVNAIGSGGGSIAWLDSAGGLRVGPHSAGAEPGPACYGRGGQDPTVTDAALILGYLNPDYFADGALTLDGDLARRVVSERLAEPMGLGVEAAARGILRVVNAQMAEGIRLVSVRQGLDPRHFVLVALGGAGPVHATALAADLSIGRVIVPRHPGVLSAGGLLAAPIEHEMTRAFTHPLADLPIASVRRELERLDRDCGALMAREGVAAAEIQVRHFADVCYIGQSYHLEVPLHVDGRAPLTRLYDDFLAVHERVNGHSTASPARLVNLRTIHQVAVPQPVDAPADLAEEEPLIKGQRQIMLHDAETWLDAMVYNRAAMAEGLAVEGPAIIEQADTTTVIDPGWQGQVIAGGTILITRGGEEAAK